MSLLEKTREINQLLQQQNAVDDQSQMPYNQMAVTLGRILDCNTYIINETGELIGLEETHDINNERLRSIVNSRQFPQNYTKALGRLSATEANIPIDSELTAFPIELRGSYPKGVTTIIPIYGAGERLGTVILSRVDSKFDEDDLVLGEYSGTVVGMQILYQRSRSIEADIRSATQVQMALSTLSYSEMKAVKAIFAALKGDEGRLTASNIADEIGITRSVIVNALRKLESAGIIESRSLGMKGTYIKILNNRFKESLSKK